MAQKETMTAINNFIVGCKADGVWDKITEAYLMAGVNFGGITVKLKSAPDEVVYTSDFSAGKDGWFQDATGSLLDGNVDGIGGKDDCLRYTIDSLTVSYHQAKRNNSFRIGCTYRVTGEFYIPSSNADLDGISVGDSTLQRQIFDSPTLDAWVEWDFIFTPTQDNTRFQAVALSGGNRSFTGNGTDLFYIRNVRVTKINSKLLTNNNFVSGDYQATGSGAGLTGDGSTKYIDTGLNRPVGNNLSMGVYLQTVPTTAGMYPIGSGDGAVADEYFAGFSPSGSNFRHAFGIGFNTATATTPCFGILTTRSTVDHEAYINGTSHYVNTFTQQLNTSVEYCLYRLHANSGTYADATLTFAHFGTALTDTDASNLSLRVNKLMYDLGCNTYYDAGTLGGLDSEVAAYVSNVFNAGGDFE